MKNKFSGIEKRRYVRLNKPVLVRFRALGGSKNTSKTEWEYGISRDISKGGICLALLDPDKKRKQIMLDKKLVLELEIPLYFKKKTVFKGDVEYIKAVGKSVWNKKELCLEKDKKATQVIVGVSFKKLGHKTSKLITDFISQNISKEEEKEQKLRMAGHKNG
ncbi:MAG: PilZ domain-containing protein [Elusimicrobia bacterium]|nr:PilZ domain-containing protein [Candidatus Liberimonas magnetica]